MRNRELFSVPFDSMKEIRRDTATADGACECYVNSTEIKQGRWQEDPKVCLLNCKAQFLRSVARGWKEDVGWDDGCRKLNKGVAVHEFWSLYWCDSTFCGVGIDQAKGLGQDPTVDLIINTCQNIGFYSLLDPGPPPPGFKCKTETDTPGGCSAGPMQVPAATQGPQLATTTTTSHLIHTSNTHPTAATIRSKPTPAVAASEPTSSPTVATGSPSATATASSTTSGSRLTGQGKAAVAICSVLALILIICFILVWLRRRKRRKASFHRALRSRRGVSHNMPLAGSPTPLISPTSSAIGTRTILTPPLRLRDRKFLPSILRPGSRSPSPPLTPLTPAYSPQFGLGVSTVGSSSVFPASPICSPTTNKLIPRHERSTVTTTTATPRTLPTGPGLNSSGGGYHPPPPFLSSLTPESTFSLPIPVPGSPSPSPWATAPAHLHHHHQQPAVISGGGNRGSGSASSCYTGTGTGTSTAHSSLRHEIPIAIPYYATTAANTPAGIAAAAYGGPGRDETPPPPPPPPLPLPLPLQLSLAPHPGSPSPSRPPRPHEGMLEIPDLLTPAVVGVGAGAGAGRVGSGSGGVGTPPPPPPLSPPPTRALPRPPPGTPVTVAATARGSPAPGSGSGSVAGSAFVPGSPPPPYSAGRAGSGSGSGVGKSPPRALLGVSGSGAGPGSGSGSGSGVWYPQQRHHERGHGRAAAYPPAHSEQGTSGLQGQTDARGSWGSWSGTGRVADGNYNVGSTHVMRGTAATIEGEEVAGGGKKGEPDSPRTSQSSGVTVAGGTAASPGSRMSSMREDGIGGGKI